jgi:hypothetical protein
LFSLVLLRWGFGFPNPVEVLVKPQLPPKRRLRKSKRKGSRQRQYSL